MKVNNLAVGNNLRLTCLLSTRGGRMTIFSNTLRTILQRSLNVKNNIMQRSTLRYITWMSTGYELWQRHGRLQEFLKGEQIILDGANVSILTKCLTKWRNPWGSFAPLAPLNTPMDISKCWFNQFLLKVEFVCDKLFQTTIWNEIAKMNNRTLILF